MESSYNNPLWKHFNIPNDNITKRFKDVLKDYENLPANFYYDKDIPESYRELRIAIIRTQSRLY